MKNSSEKPVLLIYPGKYNGYSSVMPVSSLALASALHDQGYKIHILDCRVQKFLEFPYTDYLFAGITCLSGNHISHGLEIAVYLKKHFPALPLVWGGPHPSALPVETCKHELVDIVAAGEGDNTICHLANAIENHIPLSGVEGIIYKFKGEILVNKKRKVIDNMDSLSFYPYHLLSLDKYNTGEIGINTSRGCPHNCGFCYNESFHGCTYRVKSSERVLEEIECIMKIFSPTRLKFYDDNFFVNVKRVKEILEGMIAKKFKIKWDASCRPDYFYRFSHEFCELLKRSGCWKLSFGMETGSKRLQQLIKKNLDPSLVEKISRKALNYSIFPKINYMIGLPDEKLADISETIKSIKKTYMIMPDKCQIFRYFPTPGTSLAERARELGMKFPRNLEEWSMVQPKDFSFLTFLPQKRWEILQCIYYVNEFNFLDKSKKGRFFLPLEKLSFLEKSFLYILKPLAKVRWASSFFSFPYEFNLFHQILKSRFKNFYDDIYSRETQRGD